MLKAGSKATKAGRKRKRHEVFDMGAPAIMHVDEERKEEPQPKEESQVFRDVTGDLKMSKRNKAYNSHN